MENITKLETLYKRDTTGKVRIWEVEYGYTGDTAGTRTISGTQDGQKVTSEWNLSTPKNVGKVNATTALTQAEAEAKALWESKDAPDWATCRFFDYTPDGVPRFPVIVDYGKGQRED